MRVFLIRALLSLVFLYAGRALALSVTEPVFTLSVEYVSGSFTNVSTKMERGSWGQAIVDMFHPPQANTGLFELANDDGALSPRNNSNLRPGKAVKVTATYGGSSFPLFFGRITEVSLSPRVGDRTTLIQALDDWDRVDRLTYTTSLLQDYPVQSLFCTLMSMSSVRSFAADSGISDRVGFAWYRDRPATEALHELVKSGNYQIVVDGNGTYYLRDRYWSLFSTAVGTYSVGDEFRFALTQESVINQMKMSSEPRRVSTTIATVAYLPQPLSIPASSSIGFWLTFQDPNEPSADVPVASLATLTSSTDYYAATNSDGTGSNLTSTLSINFTPFAASAVTSIFNGGGTVAWLTRFQVRGYPALLLPPLAVNYDVASSQTAFGVRNVTVNNALVQDRNFMEGLAQTITADRKDGRDELNLTLVNEWPDNLRTNPGDAFSSVDSFTGYTTAWRVRGTSHEIDTGSGLRHSVSFDSETFDTAPWLVLDHTSFGKLDDGRVLGI